MRLSLVTIIAFLIVQTLSFNLLQPRATAEIASTKHATPTNLPDGFIVNLSGSNSRKPEFYNKAMLELKRLEDEPMCHRLAAHLLMNTCRGLQDINEQTLKSTKARMQRNHVESFAAALTLCDMEGVNWDIPDSCLPLSSIAMHRSIQDSKNTLTVTPAQVQACLTTLSQDHTHWMTWLHRRDSALLFCRAASIDMDKDQMFESQKMLVKIISDFTRDLAFELTNLKQSMKTQRRDADNFFQDFMEQANQMKSKFQRTMDTVSQDVKNTASSMSSIRRNGIDIQQFLQTVFQTTAEGHAEMAAKQEESLAVSTNSMQIRLANINEMSEKTEAYALVLGKALEHLSSKVETLADQHEVLGEISQGVLTALVNATDVFQIHAGQLEQASITASKIHHSLGNVATIANFVSNYTNKMSIGGFWGDRAVRLVSPPCAMIIGSYRLPPSLIRNVLLFFGGGVIGETITHIRRRGLWDWSADLLVPPTFTLLARQHIGVPKTNDIQTEDMYPISHSSGDGILKAHFDTA